MDSINLWFPVSIVPSYGIFWYMMWRLKSQIKAEAIDETKAAGAKYVLGAVVILQILSFALIILFLCTRESNLHDWIFYGSAIGIFCLSLILLFITSKVAPKKVKTDVQ